MLWLIKSEIKAIGPLQMVTIMHGLNGCHRLCCVPRGYILEFFKTIFPGRKFLFKNIIKSEIKAIGPLQMVTIMHGLNGCHRLCCVPRGYILEFFKTIFPGRKFLFKNNLLRIWCGYACCNCDQFINAPQHS